MTSETKGPQTIGLPLAQYGTQVFETYTTDDGTGQAWRRIASCDSATVASHIVACVNAMASAPESLKGLRFALANRVIEAREAGEAYAKLAAENERLRGALEELWDLQPEYPADSLLGKAIEAARAALAGKGE